MSAFVAKDMLQYLLSLSTRDIWQARLAFPMQMMRATMQAHKKDRNTRLITISRRELPHAAEPVISNRGTDLEQCKSHRHGSHPKRISGLDDLDRGGIDVALAGHDHRDGETDREASTATE